MSDETMSDEIEKAEEDVSTTSMDRRRRGPIEQSVIMGAMEMTMARVCELLGDPPLCFAKLEALQQLKPFDILALAIWIQAHDATQVLAREQRYRCGWCDRAGTILDLESEPALLAHVVVCEHNPLVPQLRRLSEQHAALAAEMDRRAKDGD